MKTNISLDSDTIKYAIQLANMRIRKVNKRIANLEEGSPEREAYCLEISHLAALVAGLEADNG